MSKPDKQWQPFENSTFSPARIRSAILPPSLTKRHFLFSRFNLVGITLPEIIIALAITAALVVLAIAQRTTEAEESGNVASLLWLPMLLFITYRSAMEFIFSISFERSMFWHGYLAILATAYGVWHGVASMYWAELDDDDEGGIPVRGWDAYIRGELQFEFLTGGILSIIMIVIVITSFHPIRKMVRRVWLWSHHIIPIAAIVFALLHGAGVVLIGFGIYLADRLFGYLYQALLRYRKMGCAGTAELLESGLIRLTFPNDVNFQPGQYMCLQLPKVSFIEYHTYSIASIPSDDKVSFLIKQDGMWTRKLARKISAENSEGGPIAMQARLHGPIGSIGLDWQSSRYEMFVLVAGGIGITPLMALYRHLADQKRRGRPLKNVTMIWCVRDQAMVRDCVESMLLSRKEGMDCEDAISTMESGGADMDGFETRIFATKGAPAGVSFPFTAPANSVEARVLGTVVWMNCRPDLRGELKGLHATACEQNMKRVAVLGCGPGGLTADLCNKAGLVSSTRARFDVHLEHFY